MSGLTNFTDTDLSGADLESLTLGLRAPGISFRGADLTGAVLRLASVPGSIFSDADLTGADLFRADISGSEAFGANLTNADLTEANITGLFGGITWFNTTCPNGLVNVGSTACSPLP